MAYILHIDTSGENSLVALAKDGNLLSQKGNEDARNHASVLNIHIDELLVAEGIKLQDIDAFCVNGGPGSYTGLRIGLATAKGFCYALDKPLIMHSRLLLLANSYVAAYPEAENFIAILQARPQEYFAAIYNRELINIKEPQHLHQSDFQDFVNGLQGNMLCAGFTDDHIKNTLKGSNCQFEPGERIDVATWVLLSFEHWKCNEFVNLANVEPLYLKQVYTHKAKNIN